MGRNQNYRGNPEQKHYYLIDDFSGGINTTDVDERLYDNEFRELVNVELFEKGKIQNRKGFGEMPILNAWLEEKLVELPTSDIYLFKVLQDEFNILNNIENYDTLANFKSAHAFNFWVYAVIIYKEGNNVNVDLLSFLNDTNEDWTFYISKLNYFTYVSPKFKPTRITGLETVTFNNDIYINKNDIAEDLTGFIKITLSDNDNVGENTPRFYQLDKSNAYIPGPYEVNNIGFNVLLLDPLQVKLDSSGVSEVLGMYLSEIDNDNIILSSIPKSGKFRLNVIFKGNLEDALNLNIAAFTYNNANEKEYKNLYYVKADSEISGIFKYDCVFYNQGDQEVCIEVSKKEQTTDYDESFDSESELLTKYSTNRLNYVAELTLPNRYTLFAKKAPEAYNYDIFTYSTVNYTYNSNTYTATADLAVNIPIVNYSGAIPEFAAGQIFPEYGTELVFCLMHQTILDEYWKAYVMMDNGVPVAVAEVDLVNEVYLGNAHQLNLTNLYRIGTTEPYSFYYWNGGYTGTFASDFTEADEYETEIVDFSFSTWYDIKDDSSLKEVKSINLKDFRMLNIGDRLVLYSGNTILFSDLGKPDYFPNYNYVILSLIANDKIQRISYFRGSWIIFTKDSIYRMSGTFGNDDFKIVLINDTIGCYAPDSVRGINNSLVFLSRDGLYMLKQSFYMEGLENVEKVDKNIKGVIDIDLEHESLLYNEQYWLIQKSNSVIVNTVKQYFNMEYKSKVFPYVVDIYAENPNEITISNGDLISIHNGIFYKYDVGYTDFLPQGSLEADIPDYCYKVSIVTPNYSLGSPTHDKKFKNIYVKTESESVFPIYVTIYLNNLVWKTPYEYAALINEFGEIEYREILGVSDITTTVDDTNNLVLSEEITPVELLEGAFVLGDSELGTIGLGANKYQTHKIVTAGKGKSMALRIEQKTNAFFAITNLGILYKLGKVKESR